MQVVLFSVIGFFYCVCGLSVLPHPSTVNFFFFCSFCPKISGIQYDNYNILREGYVRHFLYPRICHSPSIHLVFHNRVGYLYLLVYFMVQKGVGYRYLLVFTPEYVIVLAFSFVNVNLLASRSLSPF